MVFVSKKGVSLMLQSFIDFLPFGKAKGTSGPVHRAFQDFDVKRNFSEYSRACQEACTREIPQSTDLFNQQGYEKLAILSPEEVVKYRDQAFQEMKGSSQRSGKNTVTLCDFDDDSTFFDTVLEHIFNPEVDRRLLSFFGSEYMPYWQSMQKDEPSVADQRSFLWHCDKGPKTHCKILLYFTSSEDTGGNTCLIDRSATDGFSQAGYTFGKVANRVHDLAPLAKRHEIEFEPIEYKIEAGEAILFEPASVLHKGISPTKSTRYMMQITLLPSMVPWREAHAKLNASGLSERAQYAWPSHASKLTAALA